MIKFNLRRYIPVTAASAAAAAGLFGRGFGGPTATAEEEEEEAGYSGLSQPHHRVPQNSRDEGLADIACHYIIECHPTQMTRVLADLPATGT